MWLVGGVEADSPRGRIVRWSQPEIGLFDDDPYIRMSYPDLIEDGGKYFLTETQKDVARVHEIDPALLDGMWEQFGDNRKLVATRGLLLNLPASGQKLPESVDAPQLPLLLQRSRRSDYGTADLRSGFSIDLWATFRTLAPGQILMDNRTPEGKGFTLRTAGNGAVEIVLNDGRTENRWESDPGMLTAGKSSHWAVN